MISEINLMKIACETSLRGGALPIKDGLLLAVVGNFIIKKDGSYSLNENGKRIVSLSKNEEPNAKILRELLLPLILKIAPSWMAFSNLPSQERGLAIPPIAYEVLKKAGLLDTPFSYEVKKWWSTLQQEDIEIDKKYRKMIGDIGEELTMNYEEDRLKNGCTQELSNIIDHVSKKNENIGFDISSFFGFLQPNIHHSHENLMIEVKSTTSSGDNFRFYLTRNEWEMANKNIDKYLFYMWMGINIEKRKSINNKPMILSSKTISRYIPTDIHKDGKWTECRITLNLKDIDPDLIKEFRPSLSSA